MNRTILASVLIIVTGCAEVKRTIAQVHFIERAIQLGELPESPEQQRTLDLSFHGWVAAQEGRLGALTSFGFSWAVVEATRDGTITPKELAEIEASSAEFLPEAHALAQPELQRAAYQAAMVKRREQQDQQQRDEEIEHQGEQMHAEELQEAEAERRSRVLIREQGWPEPGEVICPPWKGPSQPLASIAELTDPVKVQALAASMGMEHSCRDPESKEDRRTWSCELEDRSWLFEVRVTEYLTEEAAAAALARVEEQEDEQFDSSVMRHQGRWWASFWVENGPCAELLRDQVIPLGRSMAILHGEVFAERIRATGLDIPDGCYTEEWSGAYSTKCTIFGNHVHGDFNLSTMRGDERDAPNERRMIVGGKACVEDIAGGAYAMLTDKASCEAVATAMLGPSQP